MKPRQPLFITISIVSFLVTFIFGMFTEDISFLKTLIYWFTIILGFLVSLIINSIEELIVIQKYKSLNKSEKQKFNYLNNISYLKRLKISAIHKQSDEIENQIMIDHGFDDIVELNNSLPKWWIFLFYFGIFFCICYLFLFFSTNTFANPEYEFKIEEKHAKKQIEEYWNEVPQPTIETVKLNPDYIEEGKELFNNNCSSCHKEGGLGGIGPNLTDENWINIEQKTLLQNIFYLIWNGSKNNKSMRAFGLEGELSGIQIEKISNYVYHINQSQKKSTNLGAPPQGKKVIWPLQISN